MVLLLKWNLHFKFQCNCISHMMQSCFPLAVYLIKILLLLTGIILRFLMVLKVRVQLIEPLGQMSHKRSWNHFIRLIRVRNMNQEL